MDMKGTIEGTLQQHIYWGGSCGQLQVVMSQVLI